MSNIPEGATHTAPDGTYRMARDGLWYGCADGDWVYIEGAAPNCYTKIQAEPVWSGEGLPPVGAIVYCRSHNRDVEILKEPELVPYVSAPCRALDNDELFWGGDFMPVKTPEQIASDERMADAYAMCGVASSLSNTDAAKLYDAGLRFVEVTK